MINCFFFQIFLKGNATRNSCWFFKLICPHHTNWKSLKTWNQQQSFRDFPLSGNKQINLCRGLAADVVPHIVPSHIRPCVLPVYSGSWILMVSDLIWQKKQKHLALKGWLKWQFNYVFSTTQTCQHGGKQMWATRAASVRVRLHVWVCRKKRNMTIMCFYVIRAGEGKVFCFRKRRRCPEVSDFLPVT